MGYQIGIDIGATKTNFVLLKKQQVLKKRKVLTPKTKKEIIKILEKNIKCLALGLKPNKVSGVGIGVPAPLNEKRDLILNPSNLKYLRNCPLAKIIEKDLKIKTVMDNDVNCFTLAEACLGAGRRAGMVFGITLGSGIGGGIVINGKIYRGAFGSAGEVGHMTIKFDGLKCTCGNYGCFEEYAAQKFIKRETKISPKELAQLARKGDKKAQKFWEELGRNLGIGLANIINILDPEVIVIGGGITNAGDLLLKPARREIRNRVISPISKKYVKLKRAELGDLSGAIGAAFLVSSKHLIM